MEKGTQTKYYQSKTTVDILILLQTLAGPTGKMGKYIYRVQTHQISGDKIKSQF